MPVFLKKYELQDFFFVQLIGYINSCMDSDIHTLVPLGYIYGILLDANKLF